MTQKVLTRYHDYAIMLCMENILHTSAQAAAARAAELGLPEGSTWADIDKHISAQEAEHRRIGGTALKALK